MAESANITQRARVYYEDDPDEDNAGYGLANAPYINGFLSESSLAWMMSPSEQVATTYLLERRRPSVAIEIGTRFGGSLQVISHYSRKVYSLDVDPAVKDRLAGRFPNVEYITGPSTETLPHLLSSLKSEAADLGFVLVDGDHSANGVRADINNVLTWAPTSPLLILMHDSFNPECRLGLRNSEWNSCPYVDFVELDFVTGVLVPGIRNTFRRQLWGGLALGQLLPQKRTSRFEVTGRAEAGFRVLRDKVAPTKRSLRDRAKFAAKRILGD